MGRDIAEKLTSGAVIALHGTLGAGKTTLVKGLAQGLGITENITSPTYTIISEYPWAPTDELLYAVDEPFAHEPLFRRVAERVFSVFAPNCQTCVFIGKAGWIVFHSFS